MFIKKSIQLTAAPFEELLANGEAVDLRLDEPQWADLDKGDIIEFWEDFSGWDQSPSPNARKVNVILVDMFRSASFSDLLSCPDIDRFFCHDDKDNILLSLRKWWTKDREEKIGVLGLKVKIIPS